MTTKKCMSCGGSMSKMKKGGTKKACPPGYHWTANGCDKTTPQSKGPLSSASARLGLGTIVGIAATGITNALAKKRAAKKLEKEVAVKKAETTKQKKGGAIKKYAMGGFAPAQKGGSNTKMGIYGIPNAGGTGPETMKKGGAMKSKTIKKK